MNGSKYIKQALIASLCEHPEAEKYRQRAFSAGRIEQVMESLAQPQTLTKADFLTPDDDGRLIIDSTNAWKNFDRILKSLEASGDTFNFNDFIMPLGTSPAKNLLDVARANGGLGKIFTVDVWQDRFDEMERLWFLLYAPERREIGKNAGLVALDLKRRMYALKGLTTPEDRLSKAGLTLASVRAAFDRDGNLPGVIASLQAAGDYLRKEYLMLSDSSGNSVFDSRPEPWTKYDAVVRHLAEHGERFEVADLTHQISTSKSILGRAAEHKMLHKVFTPAHWQDRLPDMLALWARVPEGQRTPPLSPADFDAAYAEAESMTYAAAFRERAVTGKADLLRPLNEPKEKEAPVLPLGLKLVWDNMPAIRTQLDQHGEKLTLSDLRSASGLQGDSCLMAAAKFGHFSKVADIAQNGGGEILSADLLGKDRHGVTLLGVLAEKNQLALAFTPQLWTGRLAEMKNLWREVAPAHRPQVDFEHVVVVVQQETLKQKKKGKIRFQKPE